MKEGHEACVQALLRAKANTDLQDNNGITALMNSTSKGYEACVHGRRRLAAASRIGCRGVRRARCDEHPKWQSGLCCSGRLALQQGFHGFSEHAARRGPR